MALRTSRLVSAEIAARYAFFLISVIVSACAAAQGEAAHPSPLAAFNHLTIADGLSQNSVLTILQDQKGFLWLGTWDGLNRYDGYEFVTYRHDPNDRNSLSSNAIRTLYEDRAGTLWAGTQQQGGLNKFDAGLNRWTSFRHEPDNPHSLSDSEIFAMLEDRTGVFWVGTANGLNQFDRETAQAVRHYARSDDPDSLSHSQIFCLYEDRVGTLWIGTAGGLNSYDRQRGAFVRYPQASQKIYAILEDRAGTLWLGAGDGLKTFDRISGEMRLFSAEQDAASPLLPSQITSLLEDETGRLWIGTHGGGLAIFDPAANAIQWSQAETAGRPGVGSRLITALYADRTGLIWIGSDAEGVYTYDRRREQFRNYAHDPNQSGSLSSNQVRALYEDSSGMLLVGTYGGGLNMYDRDADQFAALQISPVVMAIYEDQQGILWLGTSQGLCKFIPENGTITFYEHLPEDPNSISHNLVRVIYEDRAGTLWVGTGNGLNAFDRSTRRFVRYLPEPGNPQSLGHEYVLSIYETQDGNLWIGTYDGGLNKLDRASGQFTRYQANPENPDSISHNTVTCMLEDRAGRFWIGTGGGLNLFDREQNSFRRYTEQDGLPNNTIYGIIEDRQGALWLSTNKGISKFDPQSGAFKNYDERDGLQSNEFNGGAYYQSRSGEIFFGGIRGFTAFHPEQLEENPHRPPIVLTDFQIFNTSIVPDERGESALQRVISDTRELFLSYKDYVFSFKFAALDFTQPAKNRYAYMLEGFETRWNYSENRRYITYTNLPGGAYTLRVRGANNDGVWNDAGVSLTIHVAPPFWKTRWFYFLSALAVLAFFAVIYDMKTRQLRAESAAALDRQEKRLLTEHQRVLEDQNEQLRHEIAERKRAEAELRAAQEEIIRLEKQALEIRMAGGFAHEMRNALAGNMLMLNMVMTEESTLCEQNSELYGNIFALIETHLPENIREEVLTFLTALDGNEEQLHDALLAIRKGTRRALQITGLILDYARLGRSEPGTDRLLLQEILMQLVAAHKAQFAQQQISLSLIGAAGSTLTGNTAHFYSIVENLVLNARDALLETTDGRERRIEIHLAEANGEQRIEVRDNANGILPEIRSKIYEPFFSTKPTTGTGLGLSFVSKLVPMYRGTIHVETTVGEGTTFSVIFPIPEYEQSTPTS